MLRKYVRLILFLSSYSPLFFIFAIQNPFKNVKISYALIAIGVMSIIVLWYLLSLMGKIEPEYLVITQVNHKDGEAMSYIVTYLIPFLGIDFSKTDNWVSLLIMFGILAIIYINSNLIYTNPLLNLSGYHIFEVQCEDGKTIMMVGKGSQIPLGRNVLAVHLDENIYLGRIENAE